MPVRRAIGLVAQHSLDVCERRAVRRNAAEMMNPLRFTVWTTAVGLTLGSLAWGQTDEERAGARSLAVRAVEAYKQGKWEETADLMRRAEQIVHAPTHLFYLGQAEERLGHLVAARECYLKIVREQLPPKAAAAFVSAQEEAKDSLAALTPRIAEVTVVLNKDSADQKVAVSMDGKPIPDALVGVARPVDPGVHEFLASAPGVRSEQVRIDVGEGASETVTLTIGSGSAAGGRAAPTSPPDAPSPKPSSESGVGAYQIGAYTVLGVGVVGLGVGTVYAIVGSNKRSDANELCAPDRDGNCTGDRKAIESLDSDADQAKTISTIGFIGGGVCVAAGVTMLLLAPSKSEAPKSAWVRPYMGPQSLGLVGGF